MGSGDGDRWSTWLREQRFRGGERQSRTEDDIDGLRDRVLDRATIEPGDTVLDVGAGDGLIGLGAAERVGPDGTVIFCDISEPLLAGARAEAKRRGIHDRCAFVPARAETLAPFKPNSVDVVTLRSVLVYVTEKRAAFEAFADVLKPGGHVSLFEPIHQGVPTAENGTETFIGYDIERLNRPIPDAVAALPAKIQAYRNQASPDLESAVDFDERDLFRFAEFAGFEDIHLDFSAWSTTHWETEDWEAWLDSSYAPGVPTNREAINAALTPAEKQRFVEYVRPLVEGRTPTDDRGATAYLCASLPADR